MKVVIVKDIEERPKDCDSCPFQDFDRNCGILGEYTMLNEWVEDAPYYDLKGKGDCPLKSLPKEEESADEVVETGSYNEGYGNGYECGFADGWNACLDVITGETE